MNRRDWFRAFAGAVAGPGLAMASPAPRRYGCITVAGHTAHRQVTGETLHVYVHGIDVTRDCHEADDVEGYARVFCRDEVHHRDLMARGARHLASDHYGACEFMLRGHVVIRPGEAF
jgi:hypothetical protein